MSILTAGTQYPDLQGNAAATWHARAHRLRELASCLNVPEDEIPITLTIGRMFAVNKSDPIEDKRETAGVVVKITTIPMADIGDQPIPDYLESRSGDKVTFHRYTKRFEDFESIFDWFKEIEIVFTQSKIQEEHFDNLAEVEVEDRELD